MPEKAKDTRILFVDFNGVISYKPFWSSLQSLSHPLHQYYQQIEQLLFFGEEKIENLVDDWMLGKYTSEEVHRLLADRLHAPYQDLFEVFSQDCATLDISQPILQRVDGLRKKSAWFCILRTDNMDTFDRFTLPANPQIAASFDLVHNSYNLRLLKRTNNGQYFSSTTQNLGADIATCVLIDDSLFNCALFEALGGTSYQIRNESDVLKVLDSLQTSK